MRVWVVALAVLLGGSMVAVDTAPMPVKPLAAFNQHSQQNKKAQGDGDDLDSALTMDFPDPRPSVPICGAFCRESGVSFSTDTWHSLPEAWGPPTITSTQELEALGPHIAPVLYGGLGNVLFQLATLHVYGRKHGVPVVVGYFSHWNRQFKTFAPWGGHAPPGEGVTLKDTFPALRWCSFEYKVPVPRVFNRYAFKINQPDEIVPLPDPAMLPLYLHGYFFNHYYWLFLLCSKLSNRSSVTSKGGREWSAAERRPAAASNSSSGTNGYSTFTCGGQRSI